VALVIGNSKYVTAGLLKNSAPDAKKIAAALRSVGFSEVHEHIDIDKQGMVKALKDFSASAENAEWAVIYYAGHGMEINGVNYLLPTDVKLASEEDAPDEAVPVSRLFDRLQNSSAVKIIILDACRDNPYRARMARRSASRSLRQGLIEVKAGTGMLIAYAASPGEVAYDGGDGDNGPYALALAKDMQEKGLDIRIMFSKVHDDVLESSGKVQEPWYSAALPGKYLVFKD
jgi:uncharacterized caspase-like protein